MNNIRIVYGDNLQVLSELPENEIDLIYIDPPFNRETPETDAPCNYA